MFLHNDKVIWWLYFISPFPPLAFFTFLFNFSSVPSFLEDRIEGMVSWPVLGTICQAQFLSFHSEILFALHNDSLKCCHFDLIWDEETEAQIVSSRVLTGTGKAAWYVVRNRSGARLSGLGPRRYCSPAVRHPSLSPGFLIGIIVYLTGLEYGMS